MTWWPAGDEPRLDEPCRRRSSTQVLTVYRHLDRRRAAVVSPVDSNWNQMNLRFTLPKRRSLRRLGSVTPPFNCLLARTCSNSLPPTASFISHHFSSFSAESNFLSGCCICYQFRCHTFWHRSSNLSVTNTGLSVMFRYVVHIDTLVRYRYFKSYHIGCVTCNIGF